MSEPVITPIWADTAVSGRHWMRANMACFPIPVRIQSDPYKSRIVQRRRQGLALLFASQAQPRARSPFSPCSTAHTANIPLT